MTRIAIVGVILGLLLGDGFVVGLLTNRWTAPEAIAHAASKLDAVPEEVGDWRSRDLDKLDQRVVANAGFANYLHRQYRHQHSGAAVTVLLACGPYGPLCVHGPDVCYAGSGFLQQQEAERKTDLARKSEFLAATFVQPNEAKGGKLRIYWAWNGHGPWEAPQNPRWALRGSPVVYKLYVIQDLMTESEADSEAGARSFLQAFLPEVESRLVTR